MEYKFKRHRGIDDLQSIYAFNGNSQGDESHSSQIADYIASQGWMSFDFTGIDKTDQEAINAESARIDKANKEYIDQLYKEGKYGEEYEISVEMVHNPLLDAPEEEVKPSPLTSYSMVFLDFNDDKPKGDGQQ